MGETQRSWPQNQLICLTVQSYIPRGLISSLRSQTSWCTVDPTSIRVRPTIRPQSDSLICPSLDVRHHDVLCSTRPHESGSTCLPSGVRHFITFLSYVYKGIFFSLHVKIPHDRIYKCAFISNLVWSQTLLLFFWRYYTISADMDFSFRMYKK
jgi:hypothetical protein